MTPGRVGRTVQDHITKAARTLAEQGIPNAARDVRRLMAHALGVETDRLTLHLRDEMDEETRATFDQHVESRSKRVPVSQIIGRREFWGRRFRVTPDVLDPRPETELLVELALRAPFSRVLDLGTGSGCIIVSLLAERAETTGVGTDISPEATLVAGDNAATHGVADRLLLPLSEWYDDIGGRFDLIVSNPPYIAAKEMDDLAPEVRGQEPRIALTDEADGLTAYRRIAAGALDHLKPDGRLLVEIGPTQAADVRAIFEAAGLEVVAVHPDLDDRDRVVEARAKQG